MNWEIVDDYEALSQRAAEILLRRLAREPREVLGLPTGRTPEGTYRRIVAGCAGDARCFHRAVTFNLDEYAGIAPSHPSSFCSYMRRNLFDHVEIDPANIHIPDGSARSILAESRQLSLDEALELECRSYEAQIAEAGGLTLTFLGLGRNGHIAFNEPGTPFDSRTRVAMLAPQTRAANASDFAGGEVPDRAITMGIGTILESRSIVVLASGSSKAAVVARLREGTPSEDVPATALALHHDVLVIVDRAAASQIS